MRKTLAIFDLDGTLLDTLDDLADSMNSVLAASGMPLHSVDAYRYFVGQGVEHLVKSALAPGWEEQRPDTAAFITGCVEAMGAEYEKRRDNATRPYEGITDMLTRLADRGVRLAVFSNKPHDSALWTVARFLADHEFDMVLGARDGIPRKPHPAGVHEILRATAVPADRALFIGDTDTDVRTAKAAGVEVAGVLWGFRSRDELVGEGADFIVEGPAELLGLFGGSD